MSRSGAGNGRWVGWCGGARAGGRHTRYVFLLGGDPTLTVAVPGVALVGLIIVVVSGRWAIESGGTSHVGPPFCPGWSRLLGHAARLAATDFRRPRSKGQETGGSHGQRSCRGRLIGDRKSLGPVALLEPIEARFPIAAVTDVVVGPPEGASHRLDVDFSVGAGRGGPFRRAGGGSVGREGVATLPRHRQHRTRCSSRAVAGTLLCIWKDFNGATAIRSRDMPRPSARYFKVHGINVHRNVDICRGFRRGVH